MDWICSGHRRNNRNRRAIRGRLSRRWKAASGDQGFAQRRPMEEIHPQDRHGSAADGRAADKNRTVPAEMSRPLVPPRMKEPHKFLGDRIDACQVRPLVEVVLVTGQGQIAWRIRTTMLTGNDVFDVEGEERVIVLMELAVFAALPRALPDQFSRGSVHHEEARSRARALAWRMATMFAAMT